MTEQTPPSATNAGLALWWRGEAAEPWLPLIAWARGQRLLPLLAWRAQRQGWALPQDVLDMARQARFRTEAHQALAARQLHALGELAEQLNLPLVVVKGAAMAQAYPHPWQRAYNDIDLLVAPETAPPLLDALRARGYHAIEESLGDRAWHLPGLSPAQGGLKLEIHTALAREHGNPTFTLAQWHERLIPWDAFPGLWLPDPVDHHLYNVHHAIVHHSFNLGLLPLADFKFWTQDWDAALWERLAQRAAEFELAHVVGLALALTAWFWDEPWPDAVAARFSVPPEAVLATMQRVASGELVQKMPHVWRDMPSRSLGGWLRYARLILLGDPATRVEATFKERLLFLLRRPFRLMHNHGATLWRLARGDTHTREVWRTEQQLQEWMLGGK